MNDSSAQDLRRLLQRCAQSFKDACIRECGVIHTLASSADRVPHFSPMLAPDLELDNIDLTQIPRLLYSTGELTPEAVIQTWDALAPLALAREPNTNAIHSLLTAAVPDLPFTRPARGGDVRYEMVQFLKVGSWLERGFISFTNTSVRLNLGGCRMGFDGSSIDWSAGHRRMRRPVAFRPREATRLPLGSMRLSSARAGAVLRYVVKVVPALQGAANFVFAAAAHAGPEFEAILAGAFDVELLTGVELAKADTWNEALVLLDRSATDPRGALAAILVPLVGLGAFNESFRTEPLYTARVRREYRAAVLALQSHLIRQAKLNADPHGDGKDVANLIALQQQLGTL